MNRLRPLILPAMLLMGCASGPGPVVEPRYDDAPALRGPAVLMAAVLAGHNAARAAVGVAPLHRDERLAQDARGYAEQMARSGQFAHAHQPQGPGREGENLWMGTAGAFRYEEMVGAWVDERRNFVNAPTPRFSRTGRWEDVGHYTQVVWRETPLVGCAVAANARSEYLVRRYAPPGNVVGQRAF